MADGTTLNKAVVTKITNEAGEVTGYRSVLTEAGRRFTTEYDTDFNVIKESVEELYEGLKTLNDPDVPEVVRNNFSEAVLLFETGDTDPANYQVTLKDTPNGQTVQVIWFEVDGDGSGELVARVNIWSDTDTWNNSDGPVTSARTNYELHDPSWNYLASTHENTITASYETVSGETKTFVEEVHTSLHYNQAKPDANASADELQLWANLNPDSTAIAWDDVAFVRSSENTWTYNALPADAKNANYGRDESVTTEEERHEFFKEVDNGSWIEQVFMGAWQERDGFVEIYDENWILVSRELAPDAGYTFPELLEVIAQAEGQSAADAFSGAWDDIKAFLPDGAGDESTRFTVNDWGEIFVFGGADSEMLLRINAGMHEDIWEESWNQNYPFTKWENAWFDVQDADWTQIAHLSQWSRSKATEDAPDTWIPDETGESASIRVYEADVPNQWDALFQANYDLPDAAKDLANIWSWDDVTSISIGSETQTWFAMPNERAEESSRESGRVDYFGTYTPAGGTEQTGAFLGSIQKRDGYIEVRDREWNMLGKFVDPDNAMSFSEVSAQIEYFSEAWFELRDALPDGLPEGWSSADSVFAIDQWDRIQVFDTNGVLVGHIGSWDGEHEWTNWRGDTVTNEWYGFNFNDENWTQIGSVHGDERQVTDADLGITYRDQSHIRVDLRVEKPGSSEDMTAWNALNPNVDAIDWSQVDMVRAGDSFNTQYATPEGVDDPREADVSNEEERREFFKFEQHQGGWIEEIFLGSWQERDGFVEIYDSEWNLISRELAPGSGLKYAELLAEIEARYDVATKDLFDDVMESNADVLSSKLNIDFSDKANLLATMGIQASQSASADTIRYTINEWDDVFIFDGSGELSVRVNWDIHVNVEESPWDNHYAYNKWENAWFDFQDEDWNQIVNSSQWTRSVATEDAPENWIIDETGSNSSVRIYESDVNPVLWDSFFKNEYDVPSGITGLEWNWDAVKSISIGTETQEWLALPHRRDEAETRDGEQIEYFGSLTREDGHVDDNAFLGNITKRDGYIEVHDHEWKMVGRFLDPDVPAKDFSDIVDPVSSGGMGMMGFAEAWANLAEAMPSAWISSAVQANLKTELDNLTTGSTPEERQAVWDEVTRIMDATDVRFTTNQWDDLAVFKGGVYVGEIHAWGGSDDWTNWRGDLVENTWFGFNFNNVTINQYGHNDWDSLGSVHGGERYVTEGTNPPYLDETHIRIDFKIEEPGELATPEEIAAWNALDPNVTEIIWSDVGMVRAGDEYWTYYATPEGVENVREEQIDNVQERREFFKLEQHQDGWTQEIFLGSWQERDGFVEVRDSEGNLISRELAPGAGLTFDQLLTEIEARYDSTAADNFEEALTASAEVLSGQLKIDFNAEADLLATMGIASSTNNVSLNSIVYTINDWDDVFIFDTNGDLAVRVNWDSNSDIWEEPWDDTFGWSKWEGSWFDFQDKDFNQISNFNKWENSKATDANKELGIWEIDSEGTDNQVRIYKEDIGANGWVYFGAQYDLDSAVATALSQYYQQQDPNWDWDWDNVTSLSIGVHEDTRYPIYSWRDETETEQSERVEYYGADGQRIAIIDKRDDGVIELRDGHWHHIGEFLDPNASYDSYADLVSIAPEFEDAIEALAQDLPFTLAEFKTFKYIQSSDRDYQIHDPDNNFVLKAHVNINEHTRDDGTKHKNFYIEFNDNEWNEYGSYYGWKDLYSDGTLEEESFTTRVRVDLTDQNKADFEDYKPLESDAATEAGIVWNLIDQITIGERVEREFDTAGNAREWTSSEYEYFDYQADYNHYEYLGRQEQFGAVIELRDDNGDLVASGTDPNVPQTEGLNWFGPLTESVIGFAYYQFEDDIAEFTGWNDKLIPVQLDDSSAVVKDFAGNIVATINLKYEVQNGGSDVYWELHFTSSEGPSAGVEFSLEGQQAYDQATGHFVERSDGHTHVKLWWPEIEKASMSEQEWAELVGEISPQGDAANLINWDLLSTVKYREWRNFENVDFQNEDFDSAVLQDVEGQVRFVEQDADGNEIWDSDVNVFMHIRGVFEFTSVGKDDVRYIAVDRNQTDTTLSPLDKLGPKSDQVLDNWLAAAETNVVAELNKIEGVQVSSVDDLQILEIGDTGSGWIQLADGTKIAAFVGNVDPGPDNWGNIGWDFEVYDLTGNELFRGWGHNEPAADGVGLSPDGHYGVYFRYPSLEHWQYDDPSEWAAVVQEYAPSGTVPNLDLSNVGAIRYERIVKADDGVVSKDEYRTKLLMKEANGDINWDWEDPENIEITSGKGIEYYYAGDDDPENLVGISLEDGATLSSITDPIAELDWYIGKWIETMQPVVLDETGYNIAGHSLKATSEGGVVLVDQNSNMVGVATWAEIDPRGGVNTNAWVNFDIALLGGKSIAIQGDVRLDADGDVATDSGHFMLRASDDREWEYDDAEWDTIVDALFAKFPTLEAILAENNLTKDWIGRIFTTIEKTDEERGDGVFEITDARERIDIMQTADWNQPGQIRIINKDFGHAIFIADEYGDYEAVALVQTQNISSTAPATVFGVNSTALIENWFEIFDQDVREDFAEYMGIGTSTASGQTPTLPDLASVNFVDVTSDGLTETVGIDANGKIIFIFDDHWVDRDNEYHNGVWWGGELIHVDTGFSVEINGKAPTDTDDVTGILLADSGQMRFSLFDARIDSFEFEDDYATDFAEFVEEIGLQSPVDPVTHQRVEVYHQVKFETEASQLDLTSDMYQARFVSYDPVTRQTDWENPDNVTVQYLAPLFVELNDDWNVTRLEIDPEEYIEPTSFEDNLTAINADLGRVAEMNTNFSDALEGYKFAELGLGVIGVYDLVNEDLEAVMFDRGWDNQQSWDVFDLNTQEWTARIRFGERDTGDFEQVWIEADLSDQTIETIAEEIIGFHTGMTLDDLPEVSKIMLVEHKVPETGGHYFGFVGYNANGEYAVDLGVGNNYRPAEEPDLTEPTPVTGVYAAHYKIADDPAGWVDAEISTVSEGQALMTALETYAEARALDQSVESYDSGVHILYEPGFELTYSVREGANPNPVEQGTISLSPVISESESAIDGYGDYDVLAEKPDIGVGDFGSVAPVMLEMLQSGDKDPNNSDFDLSSSNNLFDVTVVGVTDLGGAQAALEDIALIMFDEMVDLSLDDELTGVSIV